MFSSLKRGAVPTLAALGLLTLQACGGGSDSDGFFRFVHLSPDSSEVVIDSGALEITSGQVLSVIAVDAPGGGMPFDFLILDDRA